MTNIDVPLAGAQVVAAATPPRSASPFNQARPILRGADDRCVRARVYTAAGAASGPGLSDDELRGFVESGQMFALERPVPARSGLVIWVFRPHFPQREAAVAALSAAGVVHLLDGGPDNARVALVDESDARALELRRRWRAEADERARDGLRGGQWLVAEREAELAHALAPGLDPEALALLALAHEKRGRERRAKGLVIMARNSRGAEFAERVETALAQVRADVEPSAGGLLLGLRRALVQRGLAIAPGRSARLTERTA